jgi:hypothetical protein
MVLDTTASNSELRRSEAAESSRVYEQGLVAGALGAAAMALWFLVVDVISGRPLFTPSILGAALFKGAGAVASPETVAVSFEMVAAFTWIHLLVFALIGVAASLLLDLAERQPNAGFGIVLLFVVFQFGFVALTLVLAEPVLRALTLPLVLLGNLFAAGVMALYLWRRHPRLVIEP